MSRHRPASPRPRLGPPFGVLGVAGLVIAGMVAGGGAGGIDGDVAGADAASGTVCVTVSLGGAEGVGFL